MDIVKFPIGSDVEADLSLSGGRVVLTIAVNAKPEVDALLQAVKAKLPASLQGLVDGAQAAIDSALAGA